MAQPIPNQGIGGIGNQEGEHHLNVEIGQVTELWFRWWWTEWLA